MWHCLFSRLHVVAPILDTIDDVSLKYNLLNNHASSTCGGFNWNLEFIWEAGKIGRDIDNEPTKPVPTPTIAGISAVDRRFFVELGLFDDGMDIWGGENLEMAFKVILFWKMMLTVPSKIFKNKPPQARALITVYSLFTFFTQTFQINVSDYKNPLLFH